MLYIILAILIFGVLIATHELGHFATAKLLGVKVNEFSIGMGPAVFKREKGETLYSVRLLPVGGYCAMEGEDDDSADPRAFGRAATWKKIIILCAGAAMNTASPSSAAWPTATCRWWAPPPPAAPPCASSRTR